MEHTLYIHYCIVVSTFLGVNGRRDAGEQWHGEGIAPPAHSKRRRRCFFIPAP